MQNLTLQLRINDQLELRQRQPEDSRELFALIEANRAHLREWLPWLDVSRSEDDTRHHIEATLKQAEAGTGLAGCLWHQGRIVGVTGFNEIDQANRIGHIGYWMGREHRGKGLMTAAVRALADHGFTVLGLNRQCIAAAVGNARSRAIPERLGFLFEGISREAEWLYDHFVDLARYAVTRTRWLEDVPSSPCAMGWSLRSMETADLPTVHALWQSCEGVGLSEGDNLESLITVLARNPGLSPVAVDSHGALIGAVLVGHDARRGWLYHLAVDANRRGLGIGRALAEQALAGLRAAGIRRCSIAVYADNESGAAFWRRLGWSPREDLRVMQIVP